MVKLPGLCESAQKRADPAQDSALSPCMPAFFLCTESNFAHGTRFARHPADAAPKQGAGGAKQTKGRWLKAASEFPVKEGDPC